MSAASQYRPAPTASFERPWLAELTPKAVLWNVNVLVIEDDAADANLILNVLERHPDVAATHVMDQPEAALQLLANGALAPDLILVDIRMPRVDGFLFVERLRFIPGMADTPVAFLTTSRSACDVETARGLFVSCYVVKPDTFADLRARLDVVINRVKSGAWSSK
jgi:CheY-like chemotaxis protein